MLGKKHTTDAIKRMVHSHNNKGSYARVGKRNDLKDMLFRSTWEANYARILISENISWEYEPSCFEVDNGKDARFYVPDFYLTHLDKWVEIKGWLDEKSELKIQGLKNRFPDIFNKLIVIIESDKCSAYIRLKEIGVKEFIFYNDLKKEYKRKLPWWETS